MKTPEQGVIALIRELREMGLKYRQLMNRLSESPSPSEAESINEEIDDILNLTMATTQKLPCEKDTNGDGDCHDCHKTGGCPNAKPSPPETDAIGKAFVKLLYEQEILIPMTGQLRFRYKGSGFMSADDLRAVVAEMDRVNRREA